MYLKRLAILLTLLASLYLLSNDNNFVAQHIKTGKTYLKLADCQACQKFSRKHNVNNYYQIELSHKSTKYKKQLKKLGIKTVPSRIYNVKLTKTRQITLIQTENELKLLK